MHTYCPTSDARTADISRVPSSLMVMRWLLLIGAALKRTNCQKLILIAQRNSYCSSRNHCIMCSTFWSLDTLHCKVAVKPSKTTVSTGGCVICVRTAWWKIKLYLVCTRVANFHDFHTQNTKKCFSRNWASFIRTNAFVWSGISLLHVRDHKLTIWESLKPTWRFYDIWI